jgi:hypothetical protein
MPRLDVPFGRDGPIIDVGIWIAAELGVSWAATGSAIPEPFVVSGLVDTGARVTAIEASIVAWMGIPSIGVMEASTSLLGGEARSVPIFPLRMTFGPLEEGPAPRWRAIDAVAVKIVSPGASVLIGRDLLASCRFTYDGRKSRFQMSF